MQRLNVCGMIILRCNFEGRPQSLTPLILTPLILCWSYTSMTKAPIQAAEADSKAVNERVDKILAKGSPVNKGHKPAANHPWRNKPIGKSATEGHNVTQ